MNRVRILFALLGLLAPSLAWSQATVLQGGTWTPGHAPAYSNSGQSQPVVVDSGPAGGGGVGTGLSELDITATGTGAAPYQGQGTGPYGTLDCRYDAPITNATGYHYLCFSPYAQGGGFMAYGAAGVAAQLPFFFNINGVNYQFPFTVGGIVGPVSTTIGHIATWANTAGSLLSDGGALTFSIIGGNLASTQMPALTGGDCTSSIGTVNLTCLKTNGTPFTSAATTAIGTSGANIPLLSTANTWTLGQTFSTLPFFTGCTGYVLGASGTMSCNATIPSTAVTYTAAYTGAGARTQASKNGDVISALDFAGVDPTGATNSDAGFGSCASGYTSCTNFLAACMQGGNCLIPCGTYKFANNFIIDFGSNEAGGLNFEGSGQNCTLFQFATGKKFVLQNTNPGAGYATFYPVFHNFGVVGNVSGGPVFQVGSASFQDALNSIAFRDMWVKNTAAASGSSGTQLNQTVTFTLSNFTSNDGCADAYGYCPSAGDALQCNYCSIGSINGSFAGAKYAVHLTNFYNYGLTFDSVDTEVAWYDYAFDSSGGAAPGQPSTITIRGGSQVYCNYAINSQDGNSIIFDNPNFASSYNVLQPLCPIGHAGTPFQGFEDNNFTTPAVGAASVSIRGGYGADPTTPDITSASSPATFYNTTGRRMSVILYGGTVSQYCYGPSAGVCINVNGGTFTVEPNDEIVITWSVRPSWVWHRVE